MKTSNSIKTKSNTRYFGLNTFFKFPAYNLIALTGMNIILSSEMVFSFIPLAVLAPLGASCYLTYKESGWKAVKKFLGRSFDYKRIKQGKKYLFALLLMPILVGFCSYCLRNPKKQDQKVLREKSNGKKKNNGAHNE